MQKQFFAFCKANTIGQHKSSSQVGEQREHIPDYESHCTSAPCLGGVPLASNARHRFATTVRVCTNSICPIHKLSARVQCRIEWRNRSYSMGAMPVPSTICLVWPGRTSGVQAVNNLSPSNWTRIRQRAGEHTRLLAR